MKKTELDSALSALRAYLKVSQEHRRLLKRELCRNKYIEKALTTFMHDEETRSEYDTLFELIPPRNMCTVISGAKTSAELKESVDYHIHGIELLSQVDDSKIDYMARLFYNLAITFHESKSSAKIARSPPLRRKASR